MVLYGSWTGSASIGEVPRAGPPKVSPTGAEGNNEEGRAALASVFAGVYLV